MSTSVLGSYSFTSVPDVNGNLLVVQGNDVTLGNVTVSGTFSGNVGSIAWSSITSTPTTIAGYGITDAITTATGFSGDVSGTYNAIALTTTGVTAGTYNSVTVDTKGRVTAAGNVAPAWSTVTSTPTTVAGYGITNALTYTVGGGQVIQTIGTVVAAASAATTITLANTAPTTANGTSVWSGSITPTLATSDVRFNGTFMVGSGTAARLIAAMFFRGSTCIGVVTQYVAATNSAVPLTFDFLDAPGVTTATTYSIRVAVTSAATWYVGQSGTAYFAGLYAKNSVYLTELS